MSDGSLSVVLQGSSSDLRSSIERDKPVTFEPVWNQAPAQVQPPDALEDVYDVGSDAWRTVIATCVLSLLVFYESVWTL